MGSVWVETYETKLGPKQRIRQEKADGTRTDLKEKFYGKRPANEKAKEISDTLAAGQRIRENRKVSVCFLEYLSVVKKTLSPRTSEIKRYSLAPFIEKFGSLDIRALLPEDIEKFKYGLLESRTNGGVNIIVRDMKTCLEFCVENGYLEKNPAKKVQQFKPKEVARFLSRKEMARFYKSSPKKIRRAAFVLYNSGLRLGEFLAMSFDNLGESGLQVNNKGKKRFVPLTPRVRKIAVKCILDHWGKDAFESAWRKAKERADMGRIRPHDMRHTWASAYLQSGGTLADLMVIGGWSSMKMVAIYAHFQHNYLAARMAKLKLT